MIEEQDSTCSLTSAITIFPDTWHIMLTHTGLQTNLVFSTQKFLIVSSEIILVLGTNVAGKNPCSKLLIKRRKSLCVKLQPMGDLFWPLYMMNV